MPEQKNSNKKTMYLKLVYNAINSIFVNKLSDFIKLQTYIYFLRDIN